jgi:hypothetical protein
MCVSVVLCDVYARTRVSVEVCLFYAYLCVCMCVCECVWERKGSKMSLGPNITIDDNIPAVTSRGP